MKWIDDNVGPMLMTAHELFDMRGKLCDVSAARSLVLNDIGLAYPINVLCSAEVEEAAKEGLIGLKALIQEAQAEGDWESFVWTHPALLRLPSFYEIQDQLLDATYWSLLANIWTSEEYPGLNRAIWLKLFTSKRGSRDSLMSSEERAVLASLPDPVQIHRGAPPKIARGLSWTTSLDVAVWFAERSEFGKVFTIELPRAKIIAYLDHRSEFEIIFNPRFRWRVETADLTGDQVAECRARYSEARLGRSYQAVD